MIVLRQLGAIVARDLLVEWRTRDLVATMGVMGLATIVLFNFAVDFGRIPFSELGAPVLWLAFVFTGMTGIARSFGLERGNHCLEGILLSPIDRSVLYLGKLVVNVLVLLALDVFLVALALVFLNQGSGAVDLPGRRWLAFAAVVAVNTLGFAAVGTLFALMAQGTRRGDFLLPAVQAILTLPLLVSAVIATRRVLAVDVPLDEVAGLVKLSGAFDVVVVAVAFVVFEYVVEE